MDFFHEVFGQPYDVWHDGFDPSRLIGLTGQDRADAEEMLKVGLDQRDPIAPQAIHALAPPWAAVALRKALAGSRGWFRIEVATALDAIAPDPALASVLVEELQGGDDRYRAAIALRRFRGEATIEALLCAVATDADYLVRYHAAESVLAIQDQTPADVARHPDVFRCIVDSPDGQAIPEADRRRFQEGAERLRALRR